MNLITNVVFGNNNTSLYTTPSVLVASCILLTLVIKYFSTPSPPPYYQKGYWESRYAKKPAAYDWYLSFSQLQASSVLTSQVLQISNLRFLELGCGNSSLACEMAKQVPSIDLVSIDYSDTVIQHMKTAVDSARSSQCNLIVVNCKLIIIV